MEKNENTDRVNLENPNVEKLKKKIVADLLGNSAVQESKQVDQRVDFGSSAVFQDVLQSILQCFDFDTGTLHAFHADDQHLYLIAASQGLPSLLLEKIRKIPLGKGIAGTAAATQKPVSICNLQGDTSPFIPSSAREIGVQGSICLPLLYQGKVVGTLGAAWKGDRVLSESETGHLTDICTELAQVL